MAVIICFVILTLFHYFFTLGGILKATGRITFEHQAFSRDMSSHHIGRTLYTTSCVVTQNNTEDDSSAGQQQQPVVCDRVSETKRNVKTLEDIRFS